MIGFLEYHYTKTIIRSCTLAEVFHDCIAFEDKVMLIAKRQTDTVFKTH